MYTRRVQGSDAAVEGTTPRRGRPKTAGLQEARRKAIVSAAFAVFTQKGYDDTSIADIAAHAGIGHGTIYRYFTSKREILDHVFDFAVEKTVHALSFEELTLALADREQARELVETVGTRLFELVDREPGLLKLITVQCSAIDPELRERVTGLYSMLDAELSRGLHHLAPSTDDDGEWTRMGRLAIGMIGPGLVMTLLGDSDAAKRTHFLQSAQALVDRGVLTVPEGAAE
nr:TetR/AcrR family transcriptional regulator [Mycolicibacterium fluoranthenivorans]